MQWKSIWMGTSKFLIIKNSSGQLGAGNLTDCCSPKLISFDKLYPPPYKVKIFQVASTFRASYFLTETRTVLCCGTGGDFNQIKTPIKYDLKKKVYIFINTRPPR